MDSLLRICVVGLSVIVVGAPALASNLETALSKLENWKREYTSAQLEEWCEIIRVEGNARDPVLGKRLHNVVTNEGLHFNVRAEALRVMIEKAGEESASQLVSTFTSWCQEAGEKTDHDKRAGDRATLIHIAVAEGLDRLEQAMTDQRPILRLFTAMPKFRSGVLLGYAWRGIADSPAPLELRRASAIEHIAEFRDWGECPEPLLRMLDAEAVPALRRLFRKSNDAGEFHYHAASALAHLGDEEILPELEAWAARLAEKRQNLNAYVEGYIWRIKAQHPPKKLLGYVESKGSRWAMWRAMQLGIPKADVRKALLAHVAKLKSPGSKEDLGRLVVAKYEGLELGVLQPDDLPDVKIPEIKGQP